MGREQISSLTWSSGVGQALWGTQTASFLSTDDYINNLHVDANARPQGHLKFIGLAPRHFLLCKSPGAGHTFRCKSPGVPGGMVTGQIDTCIANSWGTNYSTMINAFPYIFRIVFNHLFIYYVIEIFREFQKYLVLVQC